MMIKMLMSIFGQMNPNDIDFCWFSVKHNKKVHLGECLTSYAKDTKEKRNKWD